MLVPMLDIRCPNIAANSFLCAKKTATIPTKFTCDITAIFTMAAAMPLETAANHEITVLLCLNFGLLVGVDSLRNTPNCRILGEKVRTHKVRLRLSIASRLKRSLGIRR